MSDNLLKKNMPLSDVIRRAFPGIQEDEAGELATSGAVHDYSADVVLCWEDAIEDIFYIILSGEVEVTKLINEEEVRVLKDLQPGDFFGEMALIHNAPRAATVTTTAPTRVLEIRKDAFHELLKRNASVSLAMVREVSRRLRENDEMAIEDLRLKARELAAAYQQLAESEYARREFLTTVAHELRTPLTAASGFLQIIGSANVQGEALEGALATVTRNLQEIISLVNNILFLQEMDMILPSFEPTDVGVLVASAIEQRRSNAQRNSVNLALRVAEEIPDIPAEPKSLERAIGAILDNAIKFSPDGGNVQIEVDRNDSEVWVTVRDQGVGISKEVLPLIFDRYFHLEQIEGRLFRGVGLGLSIAKQVIEQHGGEIEVEGEPGKGSTFTIRLLASRPTI